MSLGKNEMFRMKTATTTTTTTPRGYMHGRLRCRLPAVCSQQVTLQIGGRVCTNLECKSTVLL